MHLTMWSGATMPAEAALYDPIPATTIYLQCLIRYNDRQLRRIAFGPCRIGPRGDWPDGQHMDERPDRE